MTHLLDFIPFHGFSLFALFGLSRSAIFLSGLSTQHNIPFQLWFLLSLVIPAFLNGPVGAHIHSYNTLLHYSNFGCPSLF